MAKKQELIAMHFPVSFIREYVHKWMAQLSKEGNEQQRAIYSDIETMIQVASNVMIQKKEGN